MCISIDALASVRRISHAPGRKSRFTFVKSYLTIWCAEGSIHKVTIDTLLSICSRVAS